MVRSIRPRHYKHRTGLLHCVRNDGDGVHNDGDGVRNEVKNSKFHWLFGLLLLSLLQTTYAATPDRTQLAVWANEAVVAIYTFDYKHYVQQQKNAALYFTSEGWIAYNKALGASKLLETVQKNSYEVSAVATSPPKITTLDPHHWQATMTLLVLYQNPQYQQKQNLKVVITFSEAPSGQGIRGLSASGLQSTQTQAPCECKSSAKISQKKLQSV